MHRKSSDVAIGVLVLVVLGLLVWSASGFRGVAYVAVLLLMGDVVIRLFQSQSKWSKAFAILMLPTLLLTDLKPRRAAPPERREKRP